MGSLSFKNKVVGVYTDPSNVDLLLSELNDVGYSKNDISVLARNVEKLSEKILIHNSTTHTTGLYKDIENNFTGCDDVPKAMITDGSDGLMVGALVGLATLMIPGLGPVFAAGPIITSLAAILGGAAIGGTAGIVIGLLKDEGIPNDRAAFYHRHFNKGDILVMINTKDDDLELAKKTLRKFKPYNIDIF